MKKPIFSLSTTNLPPQKVFASWQEAMEQAGVMGEISSARPEDFSGHLQQYALDQTFVAFWQNSHLVYERTSRDCHRDKIDYYCACYISGGSAEITQGSRSLTAQRGTALLLNFGEPLSFNIKDKLHINTFHFLPSAIKKWVSSPNDITAKPLSQISPWGKAVTSLLAAITPKTLNHIETAPLPITEQIGYMLSLATQPKPGNICTYHASLFERFLNSIQSRFQEPDYNPKTLALEHGISVRTLYAVFAEAKTSFGNELMTARLKHARQLLAAPGFNQKSVAEIARLVGFTYPGHFITRFRQTFGVTPLAYKNLVKT